MIKKTPHMVVEKYDPPKKKKAIKPLSPEMGRRGGFEMFPVGKKR